MEQVTVLPTDVLLVSFDLTRGDDKRLCIVGKKSGKMLDIVNAFEGQKAEDIFRLLTTVKPACRVGVDLAHGPDMVHAGAQASVYDPFAERIGKALEDMNERAKKMQEEKT